MHFKIYNAKLLLFGEYTIIKGSKALAIPIPQFNASWQYDEDQNSNNEIDKFVDYLNNLKKEDTAFAPVNTTLFSEKLSKGLYFKSTIPLGYGLGSSGALTAAVYDRFVDQKVEDIGTLKKLFSKMESFFHGSSSGLDPLVCYTNKPILFSPDAIETTVIPEIGNKDQSIFLLDTGIERKTGVLVQEFLEHYKEKYYQTLIESKLIPITDQAIEALLKMDWDVLMNKVHDISHFQFKYFEPMIPPSIHEVWMKGLSNGAYKMKLCGAGGGGFMLGFSNDFDKATKALSDYKLIRIL